VTDNMQFVVFDDTHHYSYPCVKAMDMETVLDRIRGLDKTAGYAIYKRMPPTAFFFDVQFERVCCITGDLCDGLQREFMKYTTEVYSKVGGKWVFFD